MPARRNVFRTNPHSHHATHYMLYAWHPHRNLELPWRPQRSRILKELFKRLVRINLQKLSEPRGKLPAPLHHRDTIVIRAALTQWPRQ